MDMVPDMCSIQPGSASGDGPQPRPHGTGEGGNPRDSAGWNPEPFHREKTGKS